MANINNIENIKTLQSWDVPVVIHRTNAQPIDNASYFTQLSDAENYALSGATSYVGQELFVVNTTLSTADAYVIQDISGSLKKLATTFVGEYTQSTISGDFTDLSVIKISRADYEQAVVDAASNGVDLSNNVLYVISSDYIDAYERQIKNVVMEDDNVPSEAVNKHFVEQLSDRISQTIDNNIDNICAVISNDISGYISSINDTIDNKLCVAISNNADDISTKIWIENRVDKSISAFTNLSIVTLSKDQYADEMANKSPYGNIDKNVLYLISSDNLDMFNQKIVNLTMSDDNVPSEAVNKHYVEQLSINQSTSLNDKINALSGEIDRLSSNLSGEVGTLLRIALSTEIDSLSTDLSNAISSKIFVGEYTQSSVTNDFTNLSVIKISRADYEQAVVDAASNGVDLSNNVLYIISSDYIDAYERQIKNVVMEDDNVPSEAVNKHYVDQADVNLCLNLSNNCQVVSSLNAASKSGRNVGDVAIVSSLIATDIRVSPNMSYVSRTAYYWNGSNWEAMDGNYAADNVYFKEDMTMTYAFGKYAPKSGSTSFVLSCQGKSLAAVMQEAYTDIIPATVVDPSIEWTKQSISQEVGTTYSAPPAITAELSTGSYSFNTDPSNTGVSVLINNAVLCCTTPGYENGLSNENNVLINNSTLNLQQGSTTLTATDSDMTFTYEITANHTEASEIPVNNIGQQQPDKKIQAGTLTTSTTISVKGYRKPFWGIISAGSQYSNIGNDPSQWDSEVIRSLGQANNQSGSSTTLPTTYNPVPENAVWLIFACPAVQGAKTQVSAVDLNSQQSVTLNAFLNNNGTSVKGANNYDPIKYNVFCRKFGSPTGAQMNLKLTWS